jgi:hypothetical protein
LISIIQWQVELLATALRGHRALENTGRDAYRGRGGIGNVASLVASNVKQSMSWSMTFSASGTAGSSVSASA